MSLDKNALVAFVRQHGVGVVSTVKEDGTPEAALVYVAVTDDFELIFCALQDTRKCINLRRNSHIAVVIGWDDKKSLQYEGVADEPIGVDLDRAKQVYAAARPDAGMQMQWPDSHIFV